MRFDILKKLSNYCELEVNVIVKRVDELHKDLIIDHDIMTLEDALDEIPQTVDIKQEADILLTNNNGLVIRYYGQSYKLNNQLKYKTTDIVIKGDDDKNKSEILKKY